LIDNRRLAATPTRSVAAPARHALEALDLFAFIADDKLADVVNAVDARTGVLILVAVLGLPRGGFAPR
jgi:hypothetical protein